MEKFRGTIIWNNPFIIYSGSYVSSQHPSAFDELTKKLSNSKCFFLVLVAWSAENSANAKNLVEWSKVYTSNEMHKIIFMANSELEAEAIRKEGGDAVFIHQNSLVDSTLFHVDESSIKKYDAVYNAQFLSFKRHDLCKNLKNIALVSYNMDRNYYLNVVKPLKNYTLLNTIDEESGKLGWLGYSSVNQIYNESYSGLCLSAEEGGMHASMEYLLSGLPIVTTKSRGGRDFFFDQDNSIVVENDSTSVANAVAVTKDNYSIARSNLIRERAIKGQKAEQLKLKKLISDLVSSNSVDIDIDRLWKVIYRDKLITMTEVDRFIEDDLARISSY